MPLRAPPPSSSKSGKVYELLPPFPGKDRDSERGETEAGASQDEKLAYLVPRLPFFPRGTWASPVTGQPDKLPECDGAHVPTHTPTHTHTQNMSCLTHLSPSSPPSPYGRSRCPRGPPALRSLLSPGWTQSLCHQQLPLPLGKVGLPPVTHGRSPLNASRVN